jgi:flagellar biosynthesis protein FlhG
MPALPALDLKPAARPHLTAIASGKGGVGKTWFSVTLAQALAAQHQRVLLFDGDLGLANVDIQLGFSPTHDLGAVLAGRVTLAEAAMPIAGAGFSVLPGRSGSGALAALPADALATVLADLATLPYDHVLLDLGAGLDAANRRMAATADTLLVLVTDEPTSLTDAYAVIKLNEAEVPRADVRIVVNLATGATSGQRTYTTLARACSRFLGRTPKLAGIIRRDAHVTDTIRHQTPLLTRHPNSPAAVDVTHIAAVLGG